MPVFTAPRGLGVAPGEVDVDRRQPAAARRRVHDVVVDEREEVQQFERGAGVDDLRIVLDPARAHEGGETKRWPQALTTGQRQPTQRIEGLGQQRIDGRPTFALGGEQFIDAGLHALAHIAHALGDHDEPQ